MSNGIGPLATLSGPGRRGGAPARFAVSDHACWGYRDDAERAAAACQWLADGLQQGQRGIYVADDAVENLTAELAEVSERDARLADGSLLVFSTSELYDLSVPIDAQQQLGFYADSVQQAVGDGFQGLRVAADITPLVDDPARRAAHVHWEQVADRYMTEHPLAPLCLYDTRRIRGIDAIVASHPLHGPEPVPFALYAEQPHRSALSGELDPQTHHTLQSVMSGLPRTDGVIDASGLSFVDGRSAYLLHAELDARRREGQLLTLVSAPPMLQRIWTICGFDRSVLR